MKTIRSIYRLAAFVTSTLTLYGVWLVRDPFVQDKREWRQRIFGAWSRSFARISRMQIEVVGVPPEAPFLLVCNHLSYADIAAIRSAVNCVFVAKSEVASWPVAGPIVRDMGTIFIDRTNRRDIPRAGIEVLERLDAGEGVVVFPEGTSTAGATVFPFNSSFLEFAAKRGLGVSYASVTYFTPPGELPAYLSVCWWEDISFISHMLRLLGLTTYTARVTFGESAVSSGDRKTLARELRDRVEAIFEPTAPIGLAAENNSTPEAVIGE